MTATRAFIEDAIAGGWKDIYPHPDTLIFKIRFPFIDFENKNVTETIGQNLQTICTVHEAVLDPLAWQAVGKTRGWSNYNDSYGVPEKSQCWNFQWHRFIDHLADGKTIEEALSLI